MKDKLKWKVAPEPTGRYRSFESRSWPSACWNGDDDRMAVWLRCDLSYIGAFGKAEALPNGELITVAIKLPQEGRPSWKWVPMKAKAKNLAEAKELAQKFFEANPHAIIPKE